ncbi:MAG: Lrp/AsnC family transcriptional regulator [Candidatus Hodarchaeales archaeon]|jgi:Lrp/AsnC family transcriptional regulator for asnA, asnC and gidA
MLDSVSLQLIDELTKDSSRTFIEIAQELGRSDTAIRKRVKKLKEQGIIKRYTIEVDQRKMGYELTSFIGFDVEAEAYTSILQEIKTWKKVQSIFQTSTDHDFLMECWFHNHDELMAFLQKLENLKGVMKVCPATVIQRLK